ncbi:MAG TPA: PIN domain nuclease [Acidimicrobiales bacterium]|nr:PIN domain nuclease [Acidimicrobiales bacterium]
MTVREEKGTSWLIDKSALANLGRCADPEEWARRIDRGLIHVTTVTLLEAGYSARSSADLHQILNGPPLSSMLLEYLTPAIEDRAVEILVSLAERGQHRALSLPDILVAATAERSGLTVLHRDKDFELIAEITRQPLERLGMGDD